MANTCPKCKKSKSVVSTEDASVTYYYCESCDTGWSVDRRDPEAAVAVAVRPRAARR